MVLVVLNGGGEMIGGIFGEVGEEMSEGGEVGERMSE